MYCNIFKEDFNDISLKIKIDFYGENFEELDIHDLEHLRRKIRK